MSASTRCPPDRSCSWIARRLEGNTPRRTRRSAPAADCIAIMTLDDRTNTAISIYTGPGFQSRITMALPGGANPQFEADGRSVLLSVPNQSAQSELMSLEMSSRSLRALAKYSSDDLILAIWWPRGLVRRVTPGVQRCLAARGAAHPVDHRRLDVFGGSIDRGRTAGESARDGRPIHHLECECRRATHDGGILAGRGSKLLSQRQGLGILRLCAPKNCLV